LSFLFQLMEVPKFSKFIHGMAVLHDHVPLFPFWLSRETLSVLTPLQKPLTNVAPSSTSSSPVGSPNGKQAAAIQIAGSKKQRKRQDHVAVDVVEAGLGGSSSSSSGVVRRPTTSSVASSGKKVNIDERTPLLGGSGSGASGSGSGSGSAPPRPPKSSSVLGWIGTIFHKTPEGGPNAAFLGPQQQASQQSGSGLPVKKIQLPVRVEPKVFFANERTFLSWLHCK
jgi:hypothetical protein